MEYKGVKYVKYAASPEKEKQSAPYKTLDGAVVLVPEGMELSDTALTTIRYLRYYQNGKNCTVLLADEVGITAEADALAELIEKAECSAAEVCGSMPDFSPYGMDDGGSLVLMQDSAFGFRTYPLATQGGFPVGALEVRGDILEACEKSVILAVVYNNGNDFGKLNK